MYGVDKDGPTPSPIAMEDGGVVVNSPSIRLQAEQELQFSRLISRFNSDDFGVTQYVQGLDLLRSWGY